MNQTIGLAEAKARLSEIVDRVEGGETITILRNGNPVAEMRPARKLSPQEVVDRIRAIQKRIAKRAGKPHPTRGRLRDAMHKGHRI